MDFDNLMPFKIPVALIKVFGFWQTKNSSWVYLMYGVFMHICVIDLYIIFQIAYLFVFESFEEFADVMTLLPTILATFFKLLNLYIHISDIQVLFKTIQYLVKGEEMSEKFKAELNKVDKIFKAFFAVGSTSCFFAVITPFTQHILPYQMWFPYDYKSNETNFWLSTFFQIFGAFPNCWVAIALDLIPVIFMSYLLAMMEKLCDRLENLKNPEEIISCVNTHLQILELKAQVESAFSSILLFQALLSCFLLCTVSFVLTTVSRLDFIAHCLILFMFQKISPTKQTVVYIKLSTYMIPMMLETFLPCYYGSLITIMSKSFSTRLFNSDWIQADESHKSKVLILMEFAKKPVTISAAGIFIMNLDTFTRICNSAYSLFAVFKRVS